MDRLTASNGAPTGNNNHSLTTGAFGGPTLLQDFTLIDKMSSFDHERIPERVVHANGSGAKGYFEVTQDLSQYTKTDCLNQVGKRTPVIVRFSLVAGEKGSSDVARDPRGFAVKFYTEEGNWDLVANNTPIFFIRDAIKFPDFIHSQKQDPGSNCYSANAFWDFMSLNPESCHQFLYLFGDRGIPDGYRHMNGYSGHAFKWINAEGNPIWVKFHIKAVGGTKNLTPEEAAEIQKNDLNYATRDLYDHIAKGETAEWNVYVQLMPYEEVSSYKFNTFDITKIWSHKDYPLQELGRLVLNENPKNYFAEIEQVAFSPAHLVPGIEPSPDKMLQGRLFSYTDTVRYRLGSNFQQIPVNCPYRTKGVQNYYRDGSMNVGKNGGDSANYEPNSCGGPQEDPSFVEHSYDPFENTVGRYKFTHPNDDYVQPRHLYEKVFDKDARERTATNIANHMSDITPDREDIIERTLRVWSKVSTDLASKIASKLNFDINRIK